jgi:hypothetical protein
MLLEIRRFGESMKTECSLAWFLNTGNLSQSLQRCVAVAMMGLAFVSAAIAQQPAGAKSNSGATASASKPLTAVHKLTLTEGAWSGMQGQFTFSVKKNTLVGDGTVPVSFVCTVPREIHSIGGMQVSGAMGTESMNGKSTEDFSKIAHATGPNSFVASFQVPLSRAKYTVVVKGKFTSGTAATGSITVTSSTCKDSNSVTWDAAPLIDATQ